MTGGTGGGAEASGERSVAAGGGIGHVNTGDFVTQVERATLLPPEALTVSPAGLVHLPERTRLFVGRERELALLDEGKGIQVICGLGGIGKSTLAARWAADRVADHAVVWWITAETPDELDAGLAELARAMQPSVVGVLPEDALRERALQWLATHEGWLLVLDDVSEPADLRPLLARAGGGRILVTSRRATGWQDIARTVALDVLGPGEAVELFTGVCESDDGLDALCEELGYLPLALKQAAAYCAEAGITPRTYLELLGAYPAEMFAATAEGGEAARTLARVWQVTLDRLEETPNAVVALRVMAWWAPEGIPRRLLEPLGTPLEVTEAVRRLAAHSMVTVRGGDLAVHRLVQAVVRADPAEETVMVRESAAGLLKVGMARCPGDADRQVAVHAEAMAGHTDPAEDTEVEARVFLTAGTAFGKGMAVGRSVRLLERALNGSRRLLGPDHEVTLLAQQTLASAPHPMQDSRRRELLEDGLERHVDVFGPDDPRTLQARSALASSMRRHDPDRAWELLNENAERSERVLGGAHPQTLTARLQLLNGVRGRSEDIPGLERLLADVERSAPDAFIVYGEAKRSLALALDRRGERERALALSAELVEDLRLRCGDEHFLTLGARHTHICLLVLAGGSADRARALGAELLEDSVRALGECEFTWLVRKTLGSVPPGSPALS